jgi:hypothetical protein
MVAAVSAVALIFIMFVFDWFGYEDVPGGASAWEWMSFLDIVLFLCALVTIVLVGMRANGQTPQLPAPPGTIIAGAATLAVVIIAFRLLVPGDGPGDELADAVGVDLDGTRKIGLYLGLVAAGFMGWGGYTAMNERASGAAPGTGTSAPPPPPPPPASTPPSEPPASGPPA